MAKEGVNLTCAVPRRRRSMLQVATRRALLDLPAHPAWAWMLGNERRDEDTVGSLFSAGA
eukprot:5708265-Amphidinium_carterae.1